MAMTDAEFTFAKSQAITASAAGKDAAGAAQLYDAGPFATGNSKIALQTPQGSLGLVMIVETAFGSANGTATLTPKLQTDDNSSFSSATDLVAAPFGSLIPVGSLTKGAMFTYRLPDGQVFERYNRLYFTVGTENFNAGVLSVYGVLDITRWTAHAVGSKIE